MRASTGAAWGVLLGVAVILLNIAVYLPAAQDWIPFHIAARMAPAGEWDSLYPATNHNLFDVSPRYQQVVVDSFGAEGSKVISAGELTAFVAPPPAAFLLTVATPMSWQSSLQLWRLLLAIPLMLALGAVAVTASRQSPEALVRYAAICLVSLPILGYVLALGQASAWLAVAACLSVVPRSRLADIAGGVALALGILTKVTPLVIVAGLWITGRRRMAAIAAAVTVTVVFGTLPWTSLDAWTRFAQVTARLASTVITDWNNASIDAFVVRALVGVADGTLRDPDAVMRYSALAIRVLCIAIAGYVALRPTNPQIRRVTAVWIGWLAISPLLWLHYLTVLVPLVAFAAGRGLFSVAVAAALSAPLVGRIVGLDDLWTGFSLGLVWLAAAGWLLAAPSRLDQAR